MFFITCFEHVAVDKLGWLDMGDRRVFGYYDSMEEAALALSENRCDMRETVYDFAVVEEIGQGIHPDVKSRRFFAWFKDKEGFFPIDEPDEFKHYCNIALG